jgi:ubiquinone biosynthesis protein
MFFPKSKIARSYHNIIRYKQIIAVLIKHGFHEFVDTSRLIQAFKLKKFQFKKKPQQKYHTRWRRIRLVLEELGPTFIKLGQFLSNRPDLIPNELCTELEKLLDDVPPFEGQTALAILEYSLGVKKDDIFKKFAIEPFSSASISQVHKAYLKDGTKVAVKIQRPAIRTKIDSDIAIMLHIAGSISKHVQGAEILNPISIVEEFRDGLYNELDFENEALNIEKFTKLFSENKNLSVPKVYKDYSSKTILTMEYMEGIKFSEYAKHDFDHDLITDRLADLVLSQIFEYGYFHADPHSGNLIIQEDNRICFIDFGLMGILPPKHKGALCDIIIGLVNHDPDRITKAMLHLSLNKEVESRNTLEYQVFKLIEHYAYLPFEDINIGHFLRDLLKLLVNNKLILPSDIFLLLKTLISLEGTIRKIKPKFDMISHVEPFVKKMMYNNASPGKIMKDIYASGLDYAHLLCELPSEIRELLDQIKNKTFKLQFEHKGLEPMLKKTDQISNRLSFAVVTASMVIGSSLLLKTKVPPTIYGVSGVGILVFIFSVLLGGVLLISIIRHGRM